MTSRIYYAEPNRATFEACVADCEAGDRIEVVLDQTAFYPTSGGQPFDVGVLDDARVLDVVEREDGVVIHVVDRPLPVGARVSGVIDWTRRFDHMQQHSGQHVLSAAWDRLFQVRTESFHLGANASTIDLAREVTGTEIRRAEDEANRIVWEDRAVMIRFATAEEAAAMPLRKDAGRTGELRLIEIVGFDLSACGGTHVARTGAIGNIAISGWEKVRGGTRLEFLCGRRALDRFREWRDLFAATRRRLSLSAADLPAGIDRLQADAKSMQRTLGAAMERLAAYEARALVDRGQRVGDRIVSVEALDGWDAAGLKTLAAAAVQYAPSAAIALFSRSTPALAVIACGADARLDASVVLRSLVSAFGGKGGGKADLAQGGGLTASTGDLVQEATRLFTSS
jgi:alanyl-tRNA synthetase